MTIERAKEELLRLKKKTVSREELMRISRSNSDRELHEMVKQLELEGVLRPFKKKGSTNGNVIYPVADRYHVIIKDNFEDILPDMRLLHPSILSNGYLMRNKEKYRKHKKNIDMLSDYLYRVARSDERIYKEKISKKSRSFAIFGREKVIENEKGTGIQSLLNALGFNGETLLYYETPANDFVNFIPVRFPGAVILICENKDIFYDFRRLMFEHEKKFFWGREIDGVVFGSGWAIASDCVLTEFTEFLGLGEVEYLYCGDIDREGLKIYESLCKANPGIRIALFTELYQAMANASQKLPYIEFSDDKRDMDYDFTDILYVFKEEQRNVIKSCIEQNRRIPQEILDYTLLDENSSI